MATSDHVHELLTHGTWLRRLARSLVLDDSQADDVVQQTWLVALQNRPRDPARARAWLATVLRNLVARQGRGDARRVKREQAVSDGQDGGPGADDLVVRAEQQAVLARAVVGLPEPYRQTILLRFFEDLDASAIGRRLGVPAATVRTRLRRGLTLLRDQLDEDFGVSRREWSLGLIALAASGEGSVTLVGAASGLLTWGAAALVLVGVVGVAWWLSEPFGMRPVEPVEPAPVVAAVAGPVTPVTAPAPLPAGEPARLAGSGAAVPRAADEGDSLSGRVLGPDGRPLTGATVRFAWHADDTPGLFGIENRERLFVPTRRGPVTQAATTDGSGRFHLAEDLSGHGPRWRSRSLLIVEHEAHATVVFGNPPLQAGSNEVGPITLQPGHSVVGRIVDETGQPLTGVDVTVQAVHSGRDQLHAGAVVSEEHLIRSAQAVLWTASGVDGSFQLGGLPEGRLDLLIGRDDLAARILTDVTPAPDRALDLGVIGLVAGPRLGGRVLGVDGRPAADAAVLVEHLDPAIDPDDEDDPTVRWRHLVATDADGHFVAGGLQPGPHRISARSEGSALLVLERVEPGRTDLSLALQEPGQVLVAVLDAGSGALLEDVSIGFGLPPRLAGIDRWIRTGMSWTRHGLDGQGSALISGVGAVGMRFTADADGYSKQTVEVPGPQPGEQLRVEVALQPAVPFEGLVVDDTGAPVAGAQVQMRPLARWDDGMVGSMVSTAADGRFRVDASEGHWGLIVHSEGHRRIDHTDVMVSADDEGPHVVQLARQLVVEGVVRDGEGQPVPGARVTALASPTARVAWAARIAGATTSQPPVSTHETVADEHGVYRFLELEAGPHALLATPSGGPDLTVLGSLDEIPERTPAGVRRVDVGAETTTTVDLELLAGARLDVHVRDERGPLQASVRVLPMPASVDLWRAAVETRSGVDGHVSIPSLFPGRATLAVQADDGFVVLRPLDLRAGGTHTEPVTLAGHTLDLRVADDAGTPVAGARVLVAVQRTRPDQPYPAFDGFDQETLRRLRDGALGHYWLELTSGPDGRVRARHLPPGRPLWCYAEASSHLSDKLAIEASPLPPAEVTLTLQRAGVLAGELGSASREARRLLVELRDPASGARVANDVPSDGHWLLDPAPAGSWILQVVTRDDPPVVLERREVAVRAGDRQQHDFALR